MFSVSYVILFKGEPFISVLIVVSKLGQAIRQLALTHIHSFLVNTRIDLVRPLSRTLRRVQRVTDAA